MIVIFVNQVTNRIQYTFELVFKEILKVDLKITSDVAFFKKSDHPKFSYGEKPLDTELFFQSTPILFEKHIIRQPIEDIKFTDEPMFFHVKEGLLKFDLFGCVFYLVSRYEEYLPHVKDEHGRYIAENSLAFKGGFLDRPIINIWALQIKRIILENFPAFQFPEFQYRFLSTLDIDNAYAYKYKGPLRFFLSTGQLVLNGDFKKVKEKIKVHLGFMKDPFDSYEKQIHIHSKFNIRPLYFVLLGNYGKFDKNISHSKSCFQNLIRQLDKHAEVCIHPSYATFENPSQMETEKNRLEHILGRKVVKSRNHFIRIELPGTYETLLHCGITDDFSMGYPDQTGYRAGIGTPFYFYNLEKDIKTKLKVHPFVAMDTTLKKYMHIRSKDVLTYLKPMIDESKVVGGEFTVIFHNESIGAKGIWKNWSDVYEGVVKMGIVGK